ncbi:ATP-dependent protease-like protein [Aaosphaeria arxii CBS 175.79]|uniref:ATP-dependent protease-like protein n=1 Tax=Aaosphaeria arxii CBS 175.79 TaxID=1450172 RepID=A0A6A5Y4C7_9PLEO|nr:ATP-dependent protease-like protein [Aaosphaeria arxii CBS 175.79]KAF2019650.1 ATP-dependent protease-like protein [Aaosphaeria arxii CBS 175.79]
MNQYRQKYSLAQSGELAHRKSIPPSKLMVGHDFSQEFKDQPALDPHGDARQLVRLVQCRSCSKPLSAPVTLPCGHTTCRACLAPTRPRDNISYPNTPDRQYGITCKICDEEYPTVECSADVTLTKVMEVVKQTIARVQDTPEAPVCVLEEIPVSEDDVHDSNDEKELTSYQGHRKEFRGGRLHATFQMASDGELRYNSDVQYRASPSDAQIHAHLDAELFNGLREAAHSELDCLVCYNMMLDPTTLPCGHTFCRHCLVRVMDHSSICPICRAGIHIPPIAIQNYPSNGRLVALLKSLSPEHVQARVEALESEEDNSEGALSTPLFVCTLSLPNTPTFLHIFEPRYRLMMRRCMEGNRRFGMVMYNRSSAPQGDLGPTSFLQYGTMLEIINLELLPDGRSFVETRGVSRFRIKAYGQLDGYYVGNVERVDDVPIIEEEQLERQEVLEAQAWADAYVLENPQDPRTPENFPGLLSTDELFRRCIGFVEQMSQRSAPWLSSRIVNVYGPPPDNHKTFPFWFASVLPIAEEEKYRLLATTRVRERLLIVYSWIKRIEGQRWPSGNSCSIL